MVYMGPKAEPVLLIRRTDSETHIIKRHRAARRIVKVPNWLFKKDYYPCQICAGILAEQWLASPIKMTDRVRKELQMQVAIHRKKVIAKITEGAEQPELPNGTEIYSRESLEGKSMKQLVAIYNSAVSKDERVKALEGADGDIGAAQEIVWNTLTTAEVYVKPVKPPKDPNATPRGPRTSRDAIISVLVAENPKRPGTKGFEAFAKYKDGMTVGAFIEAGGTMADVRWDSAHGFINVTDPEG